MSERVKKAVKEIRKYEESKMRAIDDYFMELEKNPYKGLPDGFDPAAVQIKEAWLELNRAKREVTVLACKVETLVKKMESLILSMMEDPTSDEELVMDILKEMKLEVALLEDQIKNANWDAEFYEWWLSEVKKDEFFLDECHRMEEDS